MDTNVLAAPVRRTWRHSAELKARVIAACLEPGVSLSAVALANGLNANFLRTWVKAYRKQQESAEVPATANPRGAAVPMRSAPTLVPVSVPRSSEDSPSSIELEIRRQQSIVQIRWPTSEAASCAQWLRDWLR